MPRGGGVCTHVVLGTDGAGCGRARQWLVRLYAALEQLSPVRATLNQYRDVYAGILKIKGEDQFPTAKVANNYALTLNELNRFEEARSLLRRYIPVAQRDLGESDDLTLKMKEKYAYALYKDDSSTLDDLREAVATLEEIERIARRVFGGAHPTTANIEVSLEDSRAALRARETPPESS